MASKRYDICTPRAGNDGKTYWTRIGTAFEGDKGTQLIFDALPLPDKEGRCVASLFEPRAKDTTQNDTKRRDTARNTFDRDLDSEVPF